MRISITIFIILISTYILNASVLDPVIENVVHLKASKPPTGVPGIWKKKTIWKPRWVKEWKSAKVMKPIWRKVWSPVQIREWVPIPKPPPGWDSVSTPLALVHPKPQKPYIKTPQKAPLRDSLGHDSFSVQSSTKIPLWDPVPYPESQQPPPAPFLQPLSNTDFACKSGCDNSPSQTFSHSQISEIIGPRYQIPEYYQNPEYSETVNHMTRLSPEASWRPPQPEHDFQLNNRFRNFQGPSEFLVPPKFQSLPENNFPIHSINKNHPPNGVPTLSLLPQTDIKTSLRQWIPLPPENKIKGHFITKTPTQPQKFQTPNEEINKNKSSSSNAHKELFQNLNGDSREKTNIQSQQTEAEIRPDKGNDFIQEAQLVGEYHYSEFDLPNVKSELDVPPKSLQEEKKEVSAKTQERVNTVGQDGAQKATASRLSAGMKDKQKPTVTGIQHAVRQTEIRHIENKEKPNGRRIKQPEVHNTQDNLRVHKKHVANPAPNLPNSNYQQQEAIIKEIFPFHKAAHNNQSSLTNQRLPTLEAKKNQEQTLLQNDSSAANMTDANLNILQQKEIYPIFEIPKGVNPIFVHSNHRFLQSSEVNLREKPFSSNKSTKLEPVPPIKFEKVLPDKNNTIHLVFATTPNDYNHSTENLQKTTTTEPYEVIFSSSLSATEAETKSPVIIVTPANSNKP